MTSQLNVDTISAKNGTSPVTLTKQEAIKTWVNYDATDGAVRGSFGQSSLTDSSTGVFTTNHSSNFNSAEDKCLITGIWETSDEGTSSYAGAVRGLCDINQNGNVAASTSSLAFLCAYGARADYDGGAADLDGNYVALLGDLA